jgi:eukaryotic-like serine/threonine-protein kinase
VPDDAEQLARLKAALADRYRVERELGGGGMARVYLAQDLKHDRLVALKVLRPKLAAALGPERFLREVQITARLNHPHILPLLNSGEAHGFLYYVMPYVEGESLRDRLGREKQLPLDDALQIAREVADALSYAHSHDVVHRDIKPENILLESGHAVVADFGIARAITAAGGEQLTSTGIAVGTPTYMSPEQGAGEPHLDGRCDLYSLGCVLYEMLAGAPPFAGPTAQAIQARRMTDPVPSLRTVRETVPAHIEEAVMKALAKVPADRFATAEEFGEVLATPAVRLQEEGSAARQPASRRAPLRRSWLAAGAVTVIVGTGVTILFLRSRNHVPVPAQNSVAVLYFDNLSPDTADAYLADGLTDEIIARLGSIERLQVKSRTAVARYRGSSLDPGQLGKALSVAYLINGTVRRSPARLRVSVELLRASNGNRLWGQQYDRNSEDLLAIEGDIAIAVATALGGEMLSAERSKLAAGPTRDASSYDHFVKGNYYLAQRTNRGNRRAIEEYGAALRSDPGLTSALARIGYAYALQASAEPPGEPSESLFASGFAAAESALRRDPSQSDAWMAKGYLLALHEPNARGATDAFEHAVALDPRNAEAYHIFGLILGGLGQDSSEVVALGRALELDPERANTLTTLGSLWCDRSHYVEGLRWLDSALAVDPGYLAAYVFRARCNILHGQTSQARKDLEIAERLDAAHGAGSIELAVVEAREGDSLSAKHRIEHILQEEADSLPLSYDDAFVLAWALVAVDEPERAIHLLERLPRGWRLSGRLRSPVLDPLRNNPRFQRLVEESKRPSSPP